MAFAGGADRIPHGRVLPIPHAVLSGGLFPSYDLGMDDVSLPPELERFAAEAVAAGRYRDVADVVVAGVSLLQRAEAQREKLLASVLAAEAEADRDGCASLEQVETEMRAAIHAVARRST
jgi:putative addiction module CopG family antidote